MANTQETFFSLFHTEYQIKRGKIDPVNTGNDEQDNPVNEKDVSVKLRGILIPRIQRDYAQGRTGKNVGEIRKDFLHDLHDAVQNSKFCSLNFIYGKLCREKRIPGEEKYTAELLPLDGQQRLTTLFLLHWYGSRIASAAPEECTFLKNFTYHTRFSSENFCNFLNQQNLQPDPSEIEWLKKSYRDWKPEQSILPLKENVISTFLQNKSSFAASWKNDETVAGMLVMLDAIHLQFQDIPDLWERLTNENCTIRFNFHILDDVDPDDVFIKMNSRGKLLTEFEYFKADLLHQLEKLHYPASEIDALGEKIDRVWEPELWRYVKSCQLDSGQLSNYMMRFINLILDSIICCKTGIANDEKYAAECYDRNRLLLALTSDSGMLDENALGYLQNTFEAWFGEEQGSRITAFFDQYFMSGFRTSEDNPEKIFLFIERDHQLLKRALQQYGSYSFTKDDQVWMNVITEVKISGNTKDDSDVRFRLRTIRNLFYRMDRGKHQLCYILNAAVRIMRTGIIANELQEDIFGNKIDRDDARLDKKFPDAQIREEKLKAALLEKAPDIYSRIRLLEEWNYFRGRIQVLLPENIADSQEEQQRYLKRQEAFLALFKTQLDSKLNALLHHALLLSSKNLYAVAARGQYWFGAAAGDYSYQAGYFPRGDEEKNASLQEAFLTLLDECSEILKNTPDNSPESTLQSVIEILERREPASPAHLDLRYYFIKYFEPMFNAPQWSEGAMFRQNNSDYEGYVTVFL